MVRNTSYWLTSGNWENQNLLSCNFVTNVVCPPRIPPSIETVYLFWDRYVSSAKVLGSASVDSAWGQAFTNVLTFSSQYFVTWGLIKKICWEYKDCLSWDLMQDFAQEKHSVPSAFQTINKVNKRWWNRALNS